MTVTQRAVKVQLKLVLSSHMRPSQQMSADKKLRGFGDKVREKEGWEFKILDKTKDLGVKWAIEASLLPNSSSESNQESSEQEKEVLGYLQELKEEARRIIYHDHTSHLTPQSLRTRRTYDFEKIQDEAVKAYKYLKASQHGVLSAELKEEVGVFISDDVVPACLHSALVSELDLLASIEPKDLHPGSGGKVQDIIHPSLYAYKLHSTPLNSGTTRHPEISDRFFDSCMYAANDSVSYSSAYTWLPTVFRVAEDGASVEIQSYINGLGPRERYPELYKILEQVFLVTMPLLEETTSFEYIHQDTPSQDRWYERQNLRDDIEDPRILRSEWEEVLKSQAESKKRNQEQQDDARRRLHEDIKNERLKWDDFGNIDVTDERVRSAFAGRDLKVIVKASNYVLGPGDSYEGSWHIEGMPHEQIVASVIYYYDTDSAIVDQGLGLRRLRDGDSDFPNPEEYRHEHLCYRLVDELTNGDDDDDDDGGDSAEYDYPSDWEGGYTTGFSPTIGLGVVPTTNITHSPPNLLETGRILTFPNWIQHQVTGLRNESSSGKPARRKILCFFLVDDVHPGAEVDHDKDIMLEYHGFSYCFQSQKVLSTTDVPYQARGCNIATLHAILPLITQRLVGKRLPPEIVDHIIKIDDSQSSEQGVVLGMSWKAAEATRRAVMDDRRSKSEEWDNLPEYSLCEH